MNSITSSIDQEPVDLLFLMYTSHSVESLRRKLLTIQFRYLKAAQAILIRAVQLGRGVGAQALHHGEPRREYATKFVG